MNILIIGSSGNLGKSLYSHLKSKFKTSNNGLVKRKFDLEKKKQEKSMFK